LGRQHVHALRAGDARHQLHGEQGNAGLGERIEAVGVGERIEHADQGGTPFHGLDESWGGTPDGEHDIGIGNRLGVALGDLGAGGAVILVGEMRPEARARAHRDGRARFDELLDGLGRQPDARLVLSFGGHANRNHRGSVAPRIRQAQG